MSFRGGNNVPFGGAVDAILGFIYQSEVPLLAKPGKHEQCEVTESESQTGRHRCQSSIKEKEETVGGHMLGFR